MNYNHLHMTQWETQYRVVGHNGASSHITWVDTVREAMALASCYQCATVYRPDGSFMASLFDRKKAP